MQRHRRRRRELERIHEADLVEEEREGGDRDLAKLRAAADAQGALEANVITMKIAVASP